MFERSWVLGAVRTIAIETALGLLLSAGVGAIWVWARGSPDPSHTVGTAVMVGGVLWMLTGGTVLAKAAEMETMQHGVRNRSGRLADDRELLPQHTHLSPVATAVIVGGLLMGVGTLLQL